MENDELMEEDIPYINIDFTFRCSLADEPEDYVNTYIGEIYGFDEDDEHVLVGSCEVLYVRLSEALDDGLAHIDVFDATQPLLELGEALLIEPSEFSPKLYERYGDRFLYIDNLLVIDRLEIRPEYRGKGYGLGAIELILKQLRGGAELAALKAFPLQFESPNLISELDQEQVAALEMFSCTKHEARRKLVEHYMKVGFELFESDSYMVRPF